MGQLKDLISILDKIIVGSWPKPGPFHPGPNPTHYSVGTTINNLPSINDHHSHPALTAPSTTVDSIDANLLHQDAEYERDMYEEDHRIVRICFLEFQLIDRHCRNYSHNISLYFFVNHITNGIFISINVKISSLYVSHLTPFIIGSEPLYGHLFSSILQMGNCQAAEAATVVIVHPGYKIERIHWTVNARDVMNSNPGHYVAQVLRSPVIRSDNGLPVKQLKLLRPDDTLLIGQVYRLITYEDVLKEFAAKKCMKLGKLLMERGVIELRKKDAPAPVPVPVPVPNNSSVKFDIKKHNSSSRRQNGGRQRQRLQEHQSQGGGQWKPALKSISEIGN